MSTLIGLSVVMLFGFSEGEAHPDACDGFGPLSEPGSLAQADLRAAGNRRGQALGRALATLDVDGDGWLDLAVGAPGDTLGGPGSGAVYVYYGPMLPGRGLDPGDADLALFGGHHQRAGVALASAGDVDLDGRDELLVGSDPVGGPGRAWLISGRTSPTGLRDLDALAMARFLGWHEGDGFGLALAGAGDADGDGFADLVIGSPRADLAGSRAGAAVIFLGPTFGDRQAGSAEVILTGEQPGDAAGSAVAGLGDVDGDGLGDFVIGAPLSSTGGVRAGSVYLWSGAERGPASLAAAPTVLRGRGSSRLGAALAAAGDVDGDGRRDLWLGAPHQGAGRTGSAWLVSGGWLGPLDVDRVAAPQLVGPSPQAQLGAALVGDVDVDHDGSLDLAVGAPGADGDVIGAGAAFALSGPFSAKARSQTDVGAQGGAADHSEAGAALAVADLNGDGLADLVVGAPADDTAASDAGRIAVFFGGQDVADLGPWFDDADADGWGEGEAVMACEAPAGHVGRSGDCDGEDPAVHPFAAETDCGRDTNCDGSLGLSDLDGDGVVACGGDCSDLSAEVGPGQPERCGDGVDNNCDGGVDDATAADAVDWLPDADGDGFGDAALAVRACERPAFFLVPAVVVAGDCDDQDATMGPTAVEVCDGRDHDCDGQVDEPGARGSVTLWRDADGDGAGDARSPLLTCPGLAGWSANAADCDDTDAGVGPGAAEVCDGRDNDCDGRGYLGGPTTLEEHHGLLMGSADSRAGTSVAVLPAPFRQGVTALAIGAPEDDAMAVDAGAVYVLGGTATSTGAVGSLSERCAAGGEDAWCLRSLERGARFGSSVAGGDLDGDGVGDVVVGAERFSGGQLHEGAVYVFFGEIHDSRASQLRTTRHAGLRLEGGEAGAQLGAAVVVADLDGDGLDDLAVGAPQASGGGRRRGMVSIRYGGRRGEDQAPVHLWGSADEERLGSALATGDINGDGQADLVIGAPDADGRRGRAVVVFGGPIRGVALDRVWTGDQPGAALGRSVAAGDLDGDGVDDLVIGAGGGEAWRLRGRPGGPPGGPVDEVADVHLDVIGAGGGVGVGDVNGDGLADLACGAPEADAGAPDAGGARLVYGTRSWPTALSLDRLESAGRLDASVSFPPVSAANLGVPEGAIIDGVEAHAAIGAAVVIADLDGDGFADLALGGPDRAQGAGGVWIRRGGRYGTDLPPGGSFDDPIAAGTTPWWPDADLDGQGHSGMDPLRSCLMHVPVARPAAPAWAAVFEADAATDCDDTDASIHRDAPEILDDGIDQDCNGWDASIFNKPPMATACALTNPAPRTLEDLQAAAVAIDPDGDELSWTFQWTVDGVVAPGGAVLPAEASRRGQSIGLSCTPWDPHGPGIPLAASPVTIADSPAIVTACRIIPATPFTTDDLQAIAEAVDDDGDPIGLRWTWTVDGMPQPALSGSVVPASQTAQLQRWEVACAASVDGPGMSSEPVEITNRPPEVVAAVSTEAPAEDTPITCLAAGWSDPDGDPVTWSVAWRINGVAASTAPTLDGSSFDRGDRLVCQVLADDGYVSVAREMGPIVVVNAPPSSPTSVTVSPPDALDIDELSCAWLPGPPDPDGDAVVHTVSWYHDGVPWAGTVAGASGERIPFGHGAAGAWRCDVQADDGHGGTATRPEPAVVRPLPRGAYDTLRSGGTFTCAILDGGDDVKCWGANDARQLGRASLSTTARIGDQAGEMGNNNLELDLSAGVDVEGDAYRFLHLALGNAHGCALQRLADGADGRARLQVRCWGENNNGQLGIGSTTRSPDGGPISLGAAVRPVLVQAGQNHACAVMADRRLKCWGNNQYGALGLGGTLHRGDLPGEMGDTLPFVDLGAGRTVADLTMGRNHACALLEDGQVKCWGRNHVGQLGLGHTRDLGDQGGEMGDALPAVDLGGGAVVDLDAGWDSTCASFADGRVKCWGDNSRGILGLGDTALRGDQVSDMGSNLPFVNLGTGRTARHVDMGSGHACVILDNLAVKCWGQGSDGALGRGDTLDRGDHPSEVGDAMATVLLPGGGIGAALDLGVKTSCVVNTCGLPTCWGDNIDGRLGLGHAVDVNRPLVNIDLGAGRKVDGTWTCP